MNAAGRLVGLAAARARKWRADRDRRPPALRFDAGLDADPQIYYLCPDPPKPRGGVRVIYQHVDLLGASGRPAAVVHRRAGYRAGWFANDTRVIAGGEPLVVGPRDVLVVPEYFSPVLRAAPREQPVILFAQAPYYIFDTMTAADVADFESRPSAAVLTVSEDGAELLELVFRSARVLVSRPVLDTAVFYPAAAPGIRRRIAFHASRLPHERTQVLAALAASPALAGWEFAPIAGMSETEVADVLRSSAVFLSFSDLDGFGLPPAEAMACGCLVVGHHGGGGREFFDPQHSVAVPAGAYAEFIRAVEAAARAYDADPAAVTARGLRASAAVRGRYTQQGLAGDLAEVFAGHPITTLWR